MTLEDFESLIQAHVDAAITYTTTQTCDRERYIRYENAVFDTKAKLLDKIEHLISNQK